MHKKIAFWIVGGIGILIALLLATILLAPRLIQSEAVKSMIIAEISRKGGGQVAFGRADFALFPVPRVTIHEVSLHSPGIVGRIGTVTVYPELLPLLKRKVRIAKLDLQMPNLTVSLPEAGKRKFPSLSELEGPFSRFLSILEPDAPGLVIQVENGRLTLSERGHPAFSFRDIQAHIVLPPDRLRIQIACNSNLWEHLSIEGSIVPQGLKGTGQIELAGFRPNLVADYLFPGVALPVAESVVNLQTRFQAEGLRKWQAQVQGSIPSLTVRRGQRERNVKLSTVNGSFQLDEGKATATITELVLADPLLRVKGSFAADPVSSQVRLEFSSEKVDVRPLREAALAIAGDLPLTQEIFRIVRAGNIPHIAVELQGKSVTELGELEGIRIVGSMREGEIFIPGVALDLKDVSGQVLLSRGILSAEDVEARLGKAKGRAGKFRLAFSKSGPPFHLDSPLQADLAEASLLLRRLIKNETFRKELSLISNLKGHATGRLILEKKGSEIEPRVGISEMNLSANHQRVPYPIVIYKGQLSYERDKIGVTNLSGTLGASFYSGLTGRLNLGKRPGLALRCGRSTLLLDELYPWFYSLEGLRNKLQGVKAMKGTLEVSALSLQGPLAGLEDWRFDANGALKDVVLKTSAVPGPIKLASGTFRILPQQLSFAEVQAELLDAALHSTGDLYLFGQSFSKARLVLDGNVGPGATRRLFSLIHLPSAIHAPSSFRLSQAELTWERGGATAFKGNIACQDGLNLSGEVTVAPGELAVKNLLIQDKTSRARLGLFLKKKALDAHFSGNLTRETMEKLASSYLFPVGWVKGDMAIHLLNDQPGLSTASGKLEGENLELPLGLPLPLTVERFSLDAAKNEVRVKSASFILEGSKISLNGDVHFLPRGVDLDLEVSTGGIDVERLLTMFSKDKETAPQPPGGEITGKERGKEVKRAWDVPVTGKVRLQAESLSYGKYTWRPLRATISFDRKSARIGVSEAGLCGISTSGVLEVTPPRTVLHFHSVFKEEPIDEVLYCLLGTKTYLTGKLDLDANMRGQGTISELVRSLNGSLRLSAKDGRIYRWNLLAKIFAVLSVTEIFRGRIPDLAKSGLAYHSLGITGEVRNGRFVVAEAVLDSASVDLVAQGDIDLSTRQVNLLVLVAPFRNIDLIIGSIPVVGYILGKNLFAVPVRVTGDPDNPNVSVFPISAVGSGMLTTLKRILTLPVELVQPLIPGDGGK